MMLDQHVATEELDALAWVEARIGGEIQSAKQDWGRLVCRGLQGGGPNQQERGSSATQILLAIHSVDSTLIFW